jgi:hypothetical protein
MKWTKTFGLVAVAFAFVALCANEAAAQAPVLSATQAGNRVRIQWTSIAGATGYDLFVNGTLSGQFSLPASNTFVEVDAPPGTYNIAVRGTAGSVQGPLSNVVTVNVGGGGSTPSTGCTTLTAPTLTANGNGLTATFSWNAVDGAIGYRIQIGQSPGSTQVQQDVPASQTSFSGAAPFFGTFYARLLAANACGAIVSSAEVTVTLTPAPIGTGPRTPDPPEGQLLPRPTYAPAIITQMRDQFRGEFLNMCRNHTWLYRVLSRLRQIDSRWGLNFVRGHAPRVSDDVLAFNPTNVPDDLAQQIYLWDVIAGLDSQTCDTSRQDVWFNDITPFTWFGGPARDTTPCANQYCARWTLDVYRRAGFSP